MKDFQQIVKHHFAAERRRQESVVFAPSMTWRHGQTAWRRTVLFVMFNDEFLGNMEMRGTWQSFNESHCWHARIVESHAICICHELFRHHRNVLFLPGDLDPVWNKKECDMI
jgi:hypothetical protein